MHCVAGVSRSATLCLAYLTRYYCSLEEAWQHAKTIRPWVRPNYSFMEQLEQWEKVVRPCSEGTKLERLKGAELKRRKKESKILTRRLPSHTLAENVAGISARSL